MNALIIQWKALICLFSQIQAEALKTAAIFSPVFKNV